MRFGIVKSPCNLRQQILSRTVIVHTKFYWGIKACDSPTNVANYYSRTTTKYSGWSIVCDPYGLVNITGVVLISGHTAGLNLLV